MRYDIGTGMHIVDLSTEQVTRLNDYIIRLQLRKKKIQGKVIYGFWRL